MILYTSIQNSRKWNCFLWLEFFSFINPLLFITLFLYTLYVCVIHDGDYGREWHSRRATCFKLSSILFFFFFCPLRILDWHLPDMVSPSWTGSIWRIWQSQSPKTWTSSSSIPSCCTAMRDVSGHKCRYTSCLPVSYWYLRFFWHVLNNFWSEHNICTHRIFFLVWYVLQLVIIISVTFTQTFSV